MRTSLLLFILILFLIHPIAQLHWYSEIGNAGRRAVDPVTEGKINHNNSTYNNTGDIYKDGILDNFENFKNLGYPLEHYKVYFSKTGRFS